MDGKDWNVKAVDLSESIDPLTMPCCPLCDNGILDWEQMAIVVSHDTAALAHASCVVEASER